MMGEKAIAGLKLLGLKYQFTDSALNHLIYSCVTLWALVELCWFLTGMTKSRIGPKILTIQKILIVIVDYLHDIYST